MVGDFVPSSLRSEAYNDRPFKNNFTHISAPHIYATVLQNLKLQRGKLHYYYTIPFPLVPLLIYIYNNSLIKTRTHFSECREWQWLLIMFGGLFSGRLWIVPWY